MHWLDPDHLPEISGTFERFLLNPHGDADGMILSDGTEVHFPPHMSAELCAAIRPGEKPEIRIRGVRPRNSSLIAAIAIETMDGKRIVDNGPPKKHAEKERPNKDGPKPKHEKMQAEGRIRQVLHGPKGEARGALLEDGRIVRFPPHEAERIADLIVVGARLAVRGEGLTNSVGTVIEAREIGASDETLRRVEGNKPEHDKKLKHDKPKGAKAPASSDNARAV
jgi:hypothetical protein